MLRPFGREPENIYKAIQTAKLVAILNRLPADSWIATNDVNNLIVFDKEGAKVGYIDLAEDSYELFKKQVTN